MDWGTSNFRAFRIGSGGEVLQTISSAEGVLQVRPGEFADVLRLRIGPWLDAGEHRILLCGMVGSRIGWQETVYLGCPVGVAELGRELVTVPFDGAEVAIVPGVRAVDEDGVPEVMRGEETQAIGLLNACGGDGLVCLPGTHSKWVEVRGNRIEGLMTYMTGEVFSVMRRETILARTMTADEAVDRDAFARGVARSGESGGLLHHLFGVRALTLFGQLEERVSASYLSGLLIGSEVRAAMPSPTDVHVAGARTLCALYASAVALCGGRSVMHEEDAAALGLVALGRRLLWI